jgi:hypothetical protein
MNAGMQDAFNLGWKLALVVSGNGSHQLIESYEAERRPVDRSIVKSGDKAYSRMDPKGDKARQEVIEFMATPEGQDYAALAESEIGLVYEPSPLVEEIGSPPPGSPRRTVIGGRVGDVANLVTHDGNFASARPNLWERTESFCPAGGHRAPLAVAEARSFLQEAVKHMGQVPETAFVVLRGPAADEPRPEDLLYDPAALLHERLCGDAPSLCVIRPDGHLGFRCSPPSLEALASHLNRIYGSG